MLLVISRFVLSAFPADVVDFSGFPPLQNKFQGPAVVFHMNPIADIETVAVDGQGAVFQGVGHEKGDELFRKLVRPVVVGAAGHRYGKTVGLEIGPGQKIPGRLAGRIGAVGRKGKILAKPGVLGRPATRRLHPWKPGRTS